ncbi:MAG: response regulator [Verrucomicrobiales bacterium]
MQSLKSKENLQSKHGAGVCILLVEDSPDDAFFFKRIIKKAGLRCHLDHISDGRAAIRYLSGRELDPPALMFLDLKMPIMSGFEVLGWLKGNQSFQNLKIVVLSGSDDQADRVKAAELGASDYLVKPITFEMLKAQLETIAVKPQ